MGLIHDQHLPTDWAEQLTDLTADTDWFLHV